MRDAERIPHHDVGIGHAVDLVLALQCVPAAGIQLAVAIFGHPHMMLRKLSPACLHRIGVG